jgi:outer membrane protein, heavy metal efflux system
MALRLKLPALILSISLLAAASVLGQTGIGRPAPEDLVAGVGGAGVMPTLLVLETIALERNPTLVQAGAQIRISRGSALQAGLYPNPTVGYSADQVGAEGTAGEFHGLFVEQEIVTGGKLGLSRLKYVQEARQADIQLEAQRYRVLYSVRLAYFKALVNEKRFQLEQELQANADEVARTLSELENVGQANRADVLQSRMELQRSRTHLQTAQRRLQGSREELAAVVGMPELQITALAGTLDFNLGQVLDRDAALNNLLACSPEIRFARAEVVRDRIALEREQVEPIPNVNLRAESGYNFESNDAVAGVEVGVRLPLFDKNQGTIFQAQSELVRAQAEVARVDLSLRQRFARTVTDYQTALQSVQTYRNELLPQADEVRRLYAESFQQRRAAWPQVLDAQRDYYSLYEEYLDAVLEARRAEASIATFLLQGGLEQPPEPSPQGHRDATPKPR